MGKSQAKRLEAQIGAVPREKLVRGSYYFGQTELSRGIAMWDGEIFRGFKERNGRYFAVVAEYSKEPHGFWPAYQLNINHIPEINHVQK